MILFGLAVLIAAARLHTYGEPLDQDIATYAVIGHELRAGRALYAHRLSWTRSASRSGRSSNVTIARSSFCRARPRCDRELASRHLGPRGRSYVKNPRIHQAAPEREPTRLRWRRLPPHTTARVTLGPKAIWDR